MISTKKNTKAVKVKPKYNMAQNICYMIKTAWQMKEKKVIVLCVLSAFFAVVNNLISLYVTPTILGSVEVHAPIHRLALIIVAFTAAIMLNSAAFAYVRANTLYGRVTVRTGFVNLINEKACTTSYPNIYDDKFCKLLDKAAYCVVDNRSATEAVWETFTNLLVNVTCFFIYMSLLTNVQPSLFAVVLVTSLVSYLIGNHLNGYEYRHRDEESSYGMHVNYILRCEGEREMAKDIRIFGLRSWLEELYGKALDVYVGFHRKAQGVYVGAGAVDIVLTFMRNAFAYVYLVGLVINGRIGIAEFLLLFTAVGGFSEWVRGILSGFNTLHRQSLDISTVRECIEYDEVFRFGDGEHVEAAPDKPHEIRLENVTYRYPGADKDTLSNINLTLHPG